MGFHADHAFREISVLDFVHRFHDTRDRGFDFPELATEVPDSPEYRDQDLEPTLHVHYTRE